MSITEKISSSKPFVLALGALSIISAAFGLQAYFIVLCVVLAVVIMLSPSGQSAVACPAVASVVTAFTCYGKSADFAPLFVLAVPLACAVLFNIVFYKKRIKLKSLKTPVFIGLIATSAAVALGGLGINEPSAYLGWGAYYYIGLGIGLAAAYVIVRLLSVGENSETALKRIIDSVIFGGILSSCMIFMYYIICVREFAHTFSSLSFLANNPLRNEIAVFLIPASALSVLRARENKGYIAAAFSMLAASLLSSSRTALLFTTAAIILSAAYLIISRAKNKKPVIIAFSAAAVLAVAGAAVLYKLISSRTDASGMFSSVIRTELWKRGFKDFAESPIFGKGIVYSGNSRYFSTELFSLEIQWYHNAIVQIFGSFGLLGVLTYGYQAYARIKTALTSKSKYALEVLAVYFGIILLSMTEPGIFCPVPTALIPVVLFALADSDMSPEKNKAAEKPNKKRRKNA